MNANLTAPAASTEAARPARRRSPEALARAAAAAKAKRLAKKQAAAPRDLLAEITAAPDRPTRNALFVEGQAAGLTLTAMGEAAGVSRYSVIDAIKALTATSA